MKEQKQLVQCAKIEKFFATVSSFSETAQAHFLTDYGSCISVGFHFVRV
jgi:hypothetical protein